VASRIAAFRGVAMSIDDLISKWESTAKYHRKCYLQTSSHDAEIIATAKAELADEIVADLRKAKRGAS
jgi:hypothetical protein